MKKKEILKIKKNENKEINKNPLISVIIPTYNRAKIIERAIKSVIQQTYKKWELIIVDDGSVDNTKESIKNHLQDKRINYYSYPTNKGVCFARNFGIEKSKGQWIALLDSDDEFLPKKLEIQLNETLKHNANISLCNRIIITDNQPKKIITTNKSFFADYKEIITEKRTLSATTMFFKNIITKKSKFDPKQPTSNDLDFLLKTKKENRLLYIDKPLVLIHKTMNLKRISSDPKKKIKGYNRILEKIIQNKYDLNPLEKEISIHFLKQRIGFFLILNNEINKGRNYLEESFKTKEHFFSKYKLIYLISKFPWLLKASINLSKFLWKKGLLKI